MRREIARIREGGTGRRRGGRAANLSQFRVRAFRGGAGTASGGGTSG